MRQYFLAFAENHNPGGVHASYRTIRAFFRRVEEEEIMPRDWRNLMQKRKAPKVFLEPTEPISIDDARALISTCPRDNFIAERDRAIFPFLLDTGARAKDLCNTNIKDVDRNTGSVMIRYGKGGKHAWCSLGEKRVELCVLIYAYAITSLTLYLFPKMANASPMTA